MLRASKIFDIVSDNVGSVRSNSDLQNMIVMWVSQIRSP